MVSSLDKWSLVSIIIPTFNRAHTLRDTLDSILSQTYINWECIIIDDGSTDNTEGVVSAYVSNDARFQYYNRPINVAKGPNSCRNYGLKKSIGNFVQWFDSDDIYFPFALATYVAALNDNVDVVVGQLEVVDFKTGMKIKENNILSANLVEDYFIGKVAYYVCGPMWKRSFLVKQQQLFDDTIRNLDDWDFNLRMIYEKPIAKYITKNLIQYRYHENSLYQELRKLNFNEIQSEFAAREKHLLLISKNKIANVKLLKKFIRNRYKYFFREALVQKNEYRYYYLRMLIKYQIELKDFAGTLKTIFGFIVFSVFNKGYRLLK